MRRSQEDDDDTEQNAANLNHEHLTNEERANTKNGLVHEENMHSAVVVSDASEPRHGSNEKGSPRDGVGLDDNNGSGQVTSGRLPSIVHKVEWIPKRCRYDPENPFQFTLAMNMLMGFAGTFTVANLYYPQPILNILAKDFNVSFERASTVATLSQAGYAVGLLFLCPLGDKLRRRPFVLSLIWLTATVWLGLCLTNNFNAFIALSFICGVGTVTPQLMLPLVGDLAPAHRRASSLSIVVSGLALGMLIARVLSGILANYTSWRNIYWLSFGAQYLILILLFFFLPDYPAKEPGLPYFQLLWDIITMVVKEPLLLQACLTGFLLSAAFTSFWTTLTFLLASPPYLYSSLEIGFFAFIGIAVIALGPLWSRLITDRFVPLFSVVLGLSFEFAGIVIGTFVGPWSVAGPIVQAIAMDSGANFAHTANRANIYGHIAPRKRNRVNTAYMVFSFAGQLTGTAAGNRLYAQGGWIWSGSCNIAFIGFAIILCFLRGPREKGWVGWRGGWNIRRDIVPKEEESSSASNQDRGAEEAVPTGAANAVDKLAFSLYVQALLAWQQKGNEQDDQDNITGTSYFQVTGIHGAPPVKWQNDASDPYMSTVEVGYCTHRSTLFIPWHRPYLMLYEQVIYAYVKDIVDKPTGSIKEAYLAALSEVRLSYWERAFDSSLPDTIKTPDITISVPGDQLGTLKCLYLEYNPLWSYKFTSCYAKCNVQNQMGWEHKEPWTKSKRCPDANGVTNIDMCNNQMIANNRQFTETTWSLLLGTTDFDKLTCQAWRASSGVTALSSIEAMHNSIHNFSGSQAAVFRKGDYTGPLKYGSMTEVQASSFDPIFWLHHVNCERLVALWQAIQEEVIIHPFPSLLPRFNAVEHTVEDGNSRLEPWHRDDLANGNPYWIANDVKDLLSTFSAGNHYPETPLEFIDKPNLMADAVRNTIDKLYRPRYIHPAPPSGAPHEGVPPQEPIDGEPFLGAPSPTPAQTTKIWEAFVRVRNFALTGIWVIYIFLGQIPEDADDWLYSENKVGVSVCCPSLTEAAAPIAGPSPREISWSLVLLLLSGVLHERGIDVSDEAAVVQYLKRNLGWRVAQVIKNVPIQDDFNLTVGVSAQDLTLPSAG